MIVLYPSIDRSLQWDLKDKRSENSVLIKSIKKIGIILYIIPIYLVKQLLKVCVPVDTNVEHPSSYFLYEVLWDLLSQICVYQVILLLFLETR